MADWIVNTVEALGYIGIAVLMFIENVFPPIPSELIMPLAGFTAARGDVTLIGAIIAGTIGSLAGQFPLYYMGYFFGEERLKRLADLYGKWFTVSREDIDRASAWFRRRGPITIFLCRLVPGIRSLISIPAGINRMPLIPFIVYSTAGMAIWASLLAIAGYVLGENYEVVEAYVGPWSKIILGIVALAGIAWIAWRIWHVRKTEKHASKSDADADGDGDSTAPDHERASIGATGKDTSASANRSGGGSGSSEAGTTPPPVAVVDRDTP